MTLVIYLLGWLILIGGVSWALVAMHVAQHTIMIVDVILLGIAVITGATRARKIGRASTCSKRWCRTMKLVRARFAETVGAGCARLARPVDDHDAANQREP